jgi:hypothetical protein
MAIINVARVENPQEVEVVLAGPGPANLLFIYTGIAIVGYQLPGNDNMQHLVVNIDLTKFHSGRQFNSATTKLAPVVWLASIHGTDAANNFTWAIESASAMIEKTGNASLIAKCATQGEDGSFDRLAYQVNILTTSVGVRKVDVDPREVAAGERVVVVIEIDVPAAMPQQRVELKTDHRGAVFNRTGLTTGFGEVPGGSTTTTEIILTRAADFGPGTTLVTVTAAIGSLSQSVTFTVHK